VSGGALKTPLGGEGKGHGGRGGGAGVREAGGGAGEEGGCWRLKTP
jgi:hypothetical protein